MIIEAPDTMGAGGFEGVGTDEAADQGEISTRASATLHRV